MYLFSWLKFTFQSEFFLCRHHQMCPRVFSLQTKLQYLRQELEGWVVVCCIFSTQEKYVLTKDPHKYKCLDIDFILKKAFTPSSIPSLDLFIYMSYLHRLSLLFSCQFCIFLIFLWIPNSGNGIPIVKYDFVFRIFIKINKWKPKPQDVLLQGNTAVTLFCSAAVQS